MASVPGSVNSHSFPAFESALGKWVHWAAALQTLISPIPKLIRSYSLFNPGVIDGTMLLAITSNSNSDLSSIVILCSEILSPLDNRAHTFWHHYELFKCSWHDVHIVRSQRVITLKHKILNRSLWSNLLLQALYNLIYLKWAFPICQKLKQHSTCNQLINLWWYSINTVCSCHSKWFYGSKCSFRQTSELKNTQTITTSHVNGRCRRLRPRQNVWPANTIIISQAIQQDRTNSHNSLPTGLLPRANTQGHILPRDRRVRSNAMMTKRSQVFYRAAFEVNFHHNDVSKWLNAQML